MVRAPVREGVLTAGRAARRAARLPTLRPAARGAAHPTSHPTHPITQAQARARTHTQSAAPQGKAAAWCGRALRAWPCAHTLRSTAGGSRAGCRAPRRYLSWVGSTRQSQARGPPPPPAPHTVHRVSSAPRGKCTVWRCTMCGPILLLLRCDAREERLRAEPGHTPLRRLLRRRGVVRRGYHGEVRAARRRRGVLGAPPRRSPSLPSPLLAWRARKELTVEVWKEVPSRPLRSADVVVVLPLDRPARRAVRSRRPARRCCRPAAARDPARGGLGGGDGCGELRLLLQVLQLLHLLALPGFLFEEPRQRTRRGGDGGAARHRARRAVGRRAGAAAAACAAERAAAHGVDGLAGGALVLEQLEPVSHMVHQISSAPRGRRTVWQCTICVALA